MLSPKQSQNLTLNSSLRVELNDKNRVPGKGSFDTQAPVAPQALQAAGFYIYILHFKILKQG